MTYYRRREMTDAEWALAGALAASVGAVTFYLARIWLQREPLSEAPPEPAALEAEPEAAAPAAELEAAEPETPEIAAEPDIVEAEGAERPPR